MNEKKRIGILFGGCSSEYGVSLESAVSVAEQVDLNRYEVFLIGISRESGEWFWYRGALSAILEDTWLSDEHCTPVSPCLNRREHGLWYLEGQNRRVLPLDAVFPLLHGKNGEDGTVQGLCELAGLPVIGCGVLSSALCMDKSAAHRLVSAFGIRTARASLLDAKASGEQIKTAADKLGYPLFVKPNRSGSSFGVSKVSKSPELLEAVRLAFLHDSSVLLEEAVEGVEVGCAVLGTEALITGEVDEIELSGGFFDYTEKYSLQTSQIHVPARLTPQKSLEIRETAKRIYRLLHCSFFARVDLFLTPSGEIFFNEVNTIPGFTAHSRYPGMLKAAGLSLREVVAKLIEMRFE